MKKLYRRIAGARQEQRLYPPNGGNGTESAIFGRALRKGIELQELDQFHAARAVYEAALQERPGSFTATYRLALVVYRLGDTGAAVAHMERAALLEPRNALAWLGLAEMYQTLRRATEAERALRTVIEIDQCADGALNALGVSLCSCGRIDEGTSCFVRAIGANPLNAQALNNLANVRKEQGDLDLAEALYRRALAAKEDFPEAWNHLGLVRHDRGDFDGADVSFRRALSLAPGFAEAHVNLGATLHRRGRFAEAEHAYRDALNIDANLPDAHANLGDVLQVSGNLKIAEAHCRRALELRPNFADAWNNLATIHRRLGEHMLAIDECNRALAVDASHIGALNNLGAILREQQQLDVAESVFRRALKVADDDPVTRYNLSILTLLRGNYRYGFELYESRFDAFAHLPIGDHFNLRSDSGCTRWRGEPLSGKSLLVWTEQGLGDNLMAIRYLPMLKERGVSTLSVYCPPQLIRLVAQIYVDLIFEHGDTGALPDADFHCPIMSLPRAFGTTLESVPARVPYLAVPDAMRMRWRNALGNASRARVGVVWAGSSTLRDDALRSIALTTLNEVVGCDDIEWVSLQKGERAHEWADLGLGGGNYIDLCTDLLDTAALIENLDLIISVDTAVAHLAGALGKPIWLLDRYGSEWRWGQEGERTPWYPTMRIFRQRTPKDWTAVIRAISAALEPYRLSAPTYKATPSLIDEKPR